MSEPETPAEQAAEAAAIRRRWITLGEILAVIAVLISGLTLWNSYSERNASEIERAEDKKRAAAKSQTLVLRAEGKGSKLAVTALDPGQAIQSQTIAFPSPLGVKPIETLIDPRIQAGWIEDAVKKARKAGASGKASGDSRLPIAITTRFVSGGETHNDVAIYDVGYRRDGNLFGGSEIDLLGLSLVEHVAPARAKARLDAIWKERAR